MNKGGYRGGQVDRDGSGVCKWVGGDAGVWLKECQVGKGVATGVYKWIGADIGDLNI